MNIPAPFQLIGKTFDELEAVAQNCLAIIHGDHPAEVARKAGLALHYARAHQGRPHYGAA